MARVSLIMTVYNRERFVDEAIASARAQTYPDFELIIWDDGSDDGTLAIAERHAAEDPRVRVIAGPRQGRVKALIDAVALSEAPYFGLIDSDDRLAPAALEKTLPMIEADPDRAIVYTDHQLIDGTGKNLGVGPRCKTPYSREALLVEQMVFHFRLFSREIYDEVGGFDPAYQSAEDYDLVLRMSEAGDICHVPEVLYDYRTHPGAESVQGDLRQIEWSRQAVEAALERRGVADQVELRVRVFSQFSLVAKGGS